MGRTARSGLILRGISVSLSPGNDIFIRLDNKSRIINARETRRQLRLQIEMHRKFEEARRNLLELCQNVEEEYSDETDYSEYEQND